MLLRLSLIAVLVAWYQLPVMLERTAELKNPALSEPLHAGLSSAISAFGGPAVWLRGYVEQAKSGIEAQILKADWPQSSEAAPVEPTPVAVAAAPIPSVAAASQSPLTPVVAPAGGAPTPPVAPASTSVPDASSRPASVPAEASAPVPNAFQQPKTAVLMGDSVMGEIFFSFKRWAAKNTAWKSIDGHKTSSGLANTEYYDWPNVAGDLVSEYKPDLVLLTLGPNDTQDMIVDKHWVHFGKDDWKAEYKARMRHLVDIASRNGAHVYWLVPPVMRDATLERKMQVIRSVQADALAELPNVTVVDASSSFVDAHGVYEQKVTENGHTRELRAGDGIHLAPTGADIVVSAAVDAIKAAR